MLNARSLSLRLGEFDMDYISFGGGKRTLVMLPGLGDAIRSVRGSALPFALMYRIFARDFRVLVFSRRERLPEGYSIRDMAEDQARAMELLGVSGAYVLGVSQGGMIAMELAAEHPELVEKLVLANTAARSGQTAARVIGGWLSLAQAGDIRGLLKDTAEKLYSERRQWASGPMYSLIAAAVGKKSLEGFVIQARACLAHDAAGDLGRIKCPTLVIGGDEDRVLGADAAAELAAGIENSRLYICEGLGHGAYEEDPRFNARVLDFLKSGHAAERPGR